MRPLGRITARLVPLALFLLSASVHAADVVEYYHTDGIGNVRVVTDATGNVIERHDYLPFGEEWCGTAVCGANRTPGQPLRFTGKERDAETGLDYFGARYYGSRVGRFTTVDPIYVVSANLADPQLWNRYTYVRNNPLRHRDPDGRIVDTLADIASIEYGVLDIGVTLYTGGSLTSTHFTALGGDVLGAVVPFVTGVGAGIRAANAADHAVHAARAADALVSINRAQGKAAEAKVAGELVAEGQKILGSQVSSRTSLGRRVSDHVVQDAAGTISAVEVKSGNATRSAVQRGKDAEIAAGRGTFVGKNAPDALRGRQRAVETIERKPKN